MSESAKIVVLGIDPGLRDAGYAIVSINASDGSIKKIVELGLIQTRKNQLLQVRKTSDDLSRARQHAASLKSLLLKHKPSIVACELSTTTPYIIPTFSFGVMIGLIASLDLPVIEVLPKEVKKAVSGTTSASKADIIAWAMRQTARQRKIIWPTSQRASKIGLSFQGKHVSPSAAHMADALAIVWTAVQTEQFRLACAMAGAER